MLGVVRDRDHFAPRHSDEQLQLVGRAREDTQGDDVLLMRAALRWVLQALSKSRVTHREGTRCRASERSGRRVRRLSVLRLSSHLGDNDLAATERARVSLPSGEKSETRKLRCELNSRPIRPSVAATYAFHACTVSG